MPKAVNDLGSIFIVMKYFVLKIVLLDKKYFKLTMIIHYVNSASTFIQWAKTHKHLKVSISNVPDNILPAGCVGKLYDVKVFTKHGPDDAIYNENSEIRRCVS